MANDILRNLPIGVFARYHGGCNWFDVGWVKLAMDAKRVVKGWPKNFDCVIVNFETGEIYSRQGRSIWGPTLG